MASWVGALKILIFMFNILSYKKYNDLLGIINQKQCEGRLLFINYG